MSIHDQKMGNSTAFIGGILVLVAPHSIVVLKEEVYGINYTLIVAVGLLLTYSRFSIENGNSDGTTNFFEFAWMDENGQYAYVFGRAAFGIILLGIIITAIILAYMSEEDKLPGWLLILAGSLLLVIRLINLQNGDLVSGSDKSIFFIGKVGDADYYEVPLGSIIGLIAGLRVLRN